MAAEGDGAGQKARTQIGGKSADKNVKEKKRKRNIDASGPTAKQQQQPKQQEAAAPGGTADVAAGGPARKKQRRHKREEEPAQPLEPQEAQRRQRQRELRELAVKMRAEGKDYVPPRKGSQPRSKERSQDAGAGGKGGKDGKDGKGRNYLGDKTPGWRPFNSVEVIVLPIFWNNNKEEKAAVLAASERARDILGSAGLSADMDASNKYTPGQKMKYWETMGVRVRVELGPRDVANGNCVVALSTKQPGEVAAKSVVNMRHKMLDAVRAALQKAKSAGKADEEEEEQHVAGNGGEEQGQQQSTGKAKRQNAEKETGKQRQAGSESEEEEGGSDDHAEGEEGMQEEEEGDVVAAAVAAARSRNGGVLQRTANPEARKLKQQRGRDQGSRGGAVATKEAAELPAAAAATKQPSAAPFSADALEDDFGDIVEFEAEEDVLTLSKKDRIKKASKLIKAKRKAERLAGGGDTGAAAGNEPVGGTWGKKAAGAAHQGKAGGPKKPKVVTF